MSLFHSPSIVRDGLQLYLDAANPKSYPGNGSEWYDLSGNRFHMSLKNSPTFTNNGPESYFTLNGSDQFGSCDGTISGSIEATPENLKMEGNKEKTVIAITYVQEIGSLTAGIFDLGTTGVAGQHFSLRKNASHVNWRAQFWSTPDYDFTHDSRNTWAMYHVVYGSDKIGKTFLNNATLLGTKGTPFDLVTTGRPFVMGTYNVTAYYGGRIGGYLVYNKGLSEQEIKQNFNALRGRYGI
jgi:hypothetical protein